MKLLKSTGNGHLYIKASIPFYLLTYDKCEIIVTYTWTKRFLKFLCVHYINLEILDSIKNPLLWDEDSFMFECFWYLGYRGT